MIYVFDLENSDAAAAISSCCVKGEERIDHSTIRRRRLQEPQQLGKVKGI